MKLIDGLVMAFAVSLPLGAQAFSFAGGDYYSSSGDAINHYTSAGVYIDSLSVSGAETRGISFGRDGNLYVVRDNTFDANGVGQAGVDVFNTQGGLEHHYSFGGWIGGLATAGNIGFDPSGQNFYVGASDGVYRFGVGGTSGTKLIDTEANDIKVMANGDILVASNYSLSRFSATGVLQATVSENIADPLHLTRDFNDFDDVMLTDVRGIEYDAATDTTFVTMLGYSGGTRTAMNFKILALDGFNASLKGIQDYWYGADMYVADGGKLLVGSWTQAPGMFAAGDLSPLGMFGGPDALFVTAAPVPEPTSLLLLALGLATLCTVKTARTGSRG